MVDKTLLASKIAAIRDAAARVREVITQDLATRLAAASGFRNLVAHQYGALDWARVKDLAAEGWGDLLSFCDALAARVR